MAAKDKSVFGRVCTKHPRPVVATVAVVSAYLAYKGVALARSRAMRARPVVNFDELERDTIHLFLHHRWSRGPNYFPQCVKLETFLRLAKIPYTLHFTSDASLSPTGRLPFIFHNGVAVGDAGACIKYLKNTFNLTMDDKLPPEQEAVGHITRRMVETTFNYGLQRSTLLDEPEVVQKMFVDDFSLQPNVAWWLVRSMQTELNKALSAVGYDSLSKEEYQEGFLHEMESIEALLSTKPFLLGKTPTSYDCSVYAWLLVAKELKPQISAVNYLVNSSTLNSYINRMTDLAFPDLKELGVSSSSQKFIPYEMKT